MPIDDAYGQGFASLDYGETPDLKIMGEGLLRMAGQTVMRFATATARNAALTSPVAGMATWLTDAARLEIYNGSAWAIWPPRPVQTEQVSDAPYNAIMTTTDYTAVAWPRPTFIAPSSGSALVTISGILLNTNTDASTIWAAWRASGSNGFVYQDLNTTGVSAQAVRVAASRTRLLTGMTPGTTITIIPQWNISSGSSSTASTVGGTLTVQPVA
ncbi:hypothetical protein ACWGDX_13010 [Streptomyces sp. NPDC055025]